MANLKFINHLEGLAKKIEIDVKNISTLIDHPGEKGKNNEVILENFVRRILPSKYEISTGFITDKNGNLSKQIDLFIFNHLEFPDILKHEVLSLFPVDWTHAVFEVKTKIWTKDDIENAVANVRSVKELKYDEHGFQFVEPKAKNDGTITRGYQTTPPLGCIVAFSSKLKFEKIIEVAKENFGKIEDKKLHPDIIIVLGEGLIKYPDFQHAGELEIFQFPKDNDKYDAFSASIIYFTILLNNMLESKKISPFIKGCLMESLPEDFLNFPKEIK